MKKLILSALLVSSPAALAGGSQAPANLPVQVRTPAVQSTTSIPALPLSGALPRSSAGTAAAPAQAMPAAMTPAQARVLLLTAPSGTSVTLRQTVNMQMELEDVQVTGSAAKELSADKLAELRQTFSEMSSLPTEPTELVMSVGEVFPDGSRELVASTTTRMPAESEMKDFTVRIIQRVGAGGDIMSLHIESDNAELQEMFAGLSEEAMRAMNDQSNVQVYGFPLVAGHSETQTKTLEMQAIMSGLVGGMLQAMSAGEGAGDTAELQSILGSMKASPLTVTGTLTYRGTDAQGRHVFTQQSSAQPWKVTLDMPEQQGKGKANSAQGNFEVNLLNMNTKGDLAYRADGLPSRMQMDQDMRMRLAFALTGQDAGTMNMTMRLKTTTLAEEITQ